MKVPNKVRIGPHRFDIKFVNPLLLEGEEVCGLSDTQKCLLQINTFQTPSMQADTLLHEILHMVHNIQLGLTLTEDITIKEELLTTLTATSLCQVFRDNPKVINWILNSL